MQKQNLLTIIATAKNAYGLNFGDGNSPVLKVNQPNMNVKCAGSVMVGLLGGAILGNGLGAGVGLLTGMWNAYTLGCFD